MIVVAVPIVRLPSNCGELMKKTGHPPPELMQDDSRELSRWLASKPDARMRVREAVSDYNRMICLFCAALNGSRIPAGNRPVWTHGACDWCRVMAPTVSSKEFWPQPKYVDPLDKPEVGA